MPDNAALPHLPAFSPAVRRMSEADFTAALHVLKQAVDATSSGIVISDPHLPDNPIIYHNPTFERLTGYQEAEITGHNCRFLQGPDTNPEAINCIRQAVRSRTDCQVTLLNYRKDGTPFWNELYMSPVREPRTGRLTHLYRCAKRCDGPRESRAGTRHAFGETKARCRHLAGGTFKSARPALFSRS